MQRNPASFRDPSGFIFEQDGAIYRKINSVYIHQYRHLMDSGLYHALVKAKLMVEHEEMLLDNVDNGGIIILPEQVPFISYPYE